MDNVVDLGNWRRRRGSEDGQDEGSWSPELRLDRLDRAVERLSALVNRSLDQSGALEPKVETELLAIMGEITMGLVNDAAGRAERLANKLSVRLRAEGR